MNERKWWCFLLSSIFTFLLGLLSVLATRMAQSYMCSQGDVDPTSAEEKQRLKEEAKKLRLQGQNPDEAPDNDFMSEAKVRRNTAILVLGLFNSYYENLTISFS